MYQQHHPLSNLELIPADSVTAIYNNDTKTLKLSAQGVAVPITTQIHFKQLPVLGGLVFQLLGWVGPVTLGEQPYTVDTGINIELPSRTFPAGNVVFETANNKRWVVKIESLLKNGYQKPVSATVATGDSDDFEVQLVPPQEPIIVELGKSLTIYQEDKFAGKGGSVSISFDKNFVTLTDAGIQDTNQIHWTFTPIQTGNTHIVVSKGQTDPPFMIRVPYEVTIKPPHSGGTLNTLAMLSVADAKPANGSSSNGAKKSGANIHGQPLSWDGFVNAGINLIKKQHPDAELYGVDAESFTGLPADTEWGLGKIHIMTRIGGNKAAVVNSTGWGEFGQVEIVPALLGNTVVPWPVSLDIHEAFAILRKGGFKQPVEDVSLRQPLVPTIDQPLYVFHLDNQYIAVGVNDRKIHKMGLTGQEVESS